MTNFNSITGEMFLFKKKPCGIKLVFKLFSLDLLYLKLCYLETYTKININENHSSKIPNILKYILPIFKTLNNVFELCKLY